MEFRNLNNHLQYIESSGNTFNIEEKLRLQLAIKELINDLNVKNVKVVGKIIGKYSPRSLMVLGVSQDEDSSALHLSVGELTPCFAGIVKDYFLALVGKTIYWCSSSTWVFSELPAPLSAPADVQKLQSINNFFTGEFDTVLFEATGQPVLVDHEQGIWMNPKPITELDRLSYVVHQLSLNFAVPRTKLKFTPNS